MYDKYAACLVSFALISAFAVIGCAPGGGGPPDNTNTNTNVNGNGNGNANVNDNDNGNTNGNDNGNTNGNDNDNDNMNDNGNGEPMPPPEAAINALGVPPVQADDRVFLVAAVEGPTPETIVWMQDFETDPLQPNVVFDLVDLGDGTATFTASGLPAAPYTLTFRVTATYENGSSIFDTVQVFVQSGF